MKIKGLGGENHHNIANLAGHWRSLAGAMYAEPPKADMVQHDRYVCFVPILLQKTVEGVLGQ